MARLNAAEREGYGRERFEAVGHCPRRLSRRRGARGHPPPRATFDQLADGQARRAHPQPRLPGRHAGPGRRRDRRADHAAPQGEARRGVRDEHPAALHLVAVRRAPPAADEPDHRLVARARTRGGSTVRAAEGRGHRDVPDRRLRAGHGDRPGRRRRRREPAVAAIRDEAPSAGSRDRPRTPGSRPRITSA